MSTDNNVEYAISSLQYLIVEDVVDMEGRSTYVWDWVEVVNRYSGSLESARLHAQWMNESGNGKGAHVVSRTTTPWEVVL